MKNLFKGLLYITIMLLSFVTISCNNNLQSNSTYYTVTFDSDGGTTIHSQTVASGKKAVEPRSPTKTDYTFDNWYKGTSIFDFSTPITSDITLKAKWIKIHNDDLANVTNLNAASKDGAVLLWWTDVIDNDIFGYEVSHIANTNTRSAILSPIPKNSVIIPQGQESCLIRGLEYNTEYIFTVKTLDTSGNKSTGTSITAYSYQSNIKINITLPNDDENIFLTKDSAPININILSDNAITKVLCQKNGEKRTGIRPEILLADTNLKSLTITSNKTATFTVTESGWYDIIAQDTLGAYEWEQVEIKTIDKTPLEEVSYFKYTIDDENIYLTWKNPSAKDIYDSPLKNIKILYTWDENKSDSNNGSVTLEPNIESCTIPIPENKKDKASLQITSQTIDNFDNISKGNTITASWSNIIEATPEDAPEKIKNLAKRGKIEVKGEATKDTITEIAKALRTNQNIKVDLDLSELTNVEYIETELFAYCSKLKSIILPKGLKYIGDYAFSYCNSLESIIIDGSESINSYAFYKCINLVHLSISGTTKLIGCCAFRDCEKLQNITLEEGIIGIDTNAFADCRNLKTIIIPDSVIEIWNYAFEGCSALTYIKLSESITQITCGSFCNCSSLEEINIPKNVSKIENNAFEGCSNLKTIQLPNNITHIDTQTFDGCDNLSNISIPESVISIKESAFRGCKKLENLTIPESVSFIEPWAFADCISLININIPTSITTLEQGIFSGCSSLQNINIPSSVNRISRDVFQNCDNLTSIIFEDTNNNWMKTESKSYINGEQIGLMSATDTEANANLFRNNHEYYFYQSE